MGKVTEGNEGNEEKREDGVSLRILSHGSERHSLSSSGGEGWGEEALHRTR
jgi:hypothetical protein